MTYTVHVRAAAERDILRASDWYAIEAPEHVERFEDELGAPSSRESCGARSCRD